MRHRDVLPCVEVGFEGVGEGLSHRVKCVKWATAAAIAVPRIQSEVRRINMR